jgi:hypothetical protein
MNWLNPLFGIAIALSGQNAFAKNRLTDPVKIARECKNDVERLCKGLRRPAHRNLPQRKGDRIVARVLDRTRAEHARSRNTTRYEKYNTPPGNHRANKYANIQNQKHASLPIFPPPGPRQEGHLFEPEHRAA